MKHSFKYELSKHKIDYDQLNYEYEADQFYRSKKSAITYIVGAFFGSVGTIVYLFIQWLRK